MGMEIRARYVRAVGMLIALVEPYFLVAQVPRDTSYTVGSTWRKLANEFPAIEPALVPRAGVIEIHDIIYHTIHETPFGVRKLLSDLYIPEKGDGPFPVIMIIHGGGWRAGDKSLNSEMAAALAKKGFFVASLEYRLSLEARYPAALHDLNAALAWLPSAAGLYNVDINKVALLGYSAGGQLASLVGVTQNENIFDGSTTSKTRARIHAVIDLDGLLDFTHPETLAIKRNANSADMFWLEGTYEERPQRWKEASPLTWVDKNAPPFLFMNSSQTRFHAGCDEMVKQLNEFGIYNEVHKLDDAPHSYWFFHPWFDPMIDSVTKFLNKVFYP